MMNIVLMLNISADLYLMIYGACRLMEASVSVMNMSGTRQMQPHISPMFSLPLHCGITGLTLMSIYRQRTDMSLNVLTHNRGPVLQVFDLIIAHKPRSPLKDKEQQVRAIIYIHHS